ncbi:hypothetical protein EDB84DRAFT_1465737 [Lactarius hengduanensis]|nr:hypothetical protein EDB84DRAFT_1465737 [Lactarius hengduanensis]
MLINWRPLARTTRQISHVFYAIHLPVCIFILPSPAVAAYIFSVDWKNTCQCLSLLNLPRSLWSGEEGKKYMVVVFELVFE